MTFYSVPGKNNLAFYNIPEGMDYDLAVYSYDSSTNDFLLVSSSTYGGNSDETVVCQLAAGFYYIKVYSYWGSSETQSYMLSVTDENAGIVKIDFDKTSAAVGEIITATLSVDSIDNFAGYQVNLKYDPEVIQPVDDSLQPYSEDTKPTGTTVINNSNYSPVSYALNDLSTGTINFCAGYLNLDDYKQSGISETSGILGIIKFRVLKSNQIQIKFENTSKMLGSNSGVYLFDWNGDKIIGGFTVQQPQIINSSLPVNPQSVESSSVDESPVVHMMEAGAKYKISGYVCQDFHTSNANAKAGFKVEIDGKSFSLSTVTDSDGYFVITDVPSAQGYTIKITKNTFIDMEIKNVTVNSDIFLGKKDSPILMWTGDIVNDNAINISDIMFIAKCFNSINGDGKYVIDCDVNTDGVINISDIMIIASHFNRSSEDYSAVMPTGTPNGDYISLKFNSHREVTALKSDGTVWKWYESNGNAPIKQNITGVKAIACGGYHTLALKEDGTVWVWGNNFDGIFGIDYENKTYISEPLQCAVDVKAIAASDNCTAIIKTDDSVWVWGGTDENGNIKKPVKVMDEAKNISVGPNHIVVLKNDGSVWAWGDNSRGQLGVDTSIARSDIPKQSDITGVVSISAGNSHTVAIKEDGSVYAWGDNTHMQLGKGTNASYSYKPVYIDINNVKAISAGGYHTIALKNDGSVYTWGYNNYNQLGIDSTVDSNIPLKVKGIDDVRAIASGEDYTGIIKNDNSIWTWGNSLTFCFELRDVSRQIPLLNNIIDISGGENFGSGVFSALSSDGSIWSWGPAKNGRLFTQLPGIANIKSIVSGLSYAIDKDGTVWEWVSENGQISSSPQIVTKINNVEQIALGVHHAAALIKDTAVGTTVWTWGTDDDPYHADYLWNSSSPVKQEITGVSAIAAGNSFIVALKNNSVYTWGMNYWGTLGIGNTSPRYTPQLVGISGVKAITAGERFVAVLKEDGTVWTWGRGVLSSMGVNYIPVKVPGLSNIKAISAQYDELVALKDDGTVWICDDYQDAPYKVIGLNNVKSIKSSRYSTVALKNDGTVWGWSSSTRDMGISYPKRLTNEDDANLQYIAVNSEFVSGFDQNTTEYTISIPSSTNLEINVAACNPNAKVYVTQPLSIPGCLKVDVISPSGMTKKMYTVNITKSPDDQNQQSMPIIVKGSIDFGGDFDTYTFKPSETKTYTILSEGNIDVAIDVYDGEILIASDDDGGKNRNFYLEVNLSNLKSYNLKVSNFYSEGTGEYTIKIIDGVKTQLAKSEVYLEDIAQEVHGTISIEQGIYTVTIDPDHYASFDSSMYKIDPFNGKAIIDFDVFINAFGGFLTYYIVGSDSEQFTLEDNWDKQAKVDEMEKGAKDKNKYTPTAKVAPVQETLRLLGCGRKGTTYGLIKDLAVTGYYNADTVDAVREFQYKFMEIDIFKTDGEIIGDGLKNGKPDPNELNTAGELSKYNKVRLIANNRGGGKSWIKDTGVRVREYLTICYSPAFNGIFDFAMVGGVPKIYYRESQYAPKVQLLIDGLHYEPTEFKCYAKIISIEKAINAYNQQKNQIGKHISSVKILPGVINSSGKPVMGQTYELKTPKNYYFKDILMPYEDMRVVCGLFSGSYGTGQMVADTVCVASFKNFNSDTVILYFDTVNKTVKDGSGNIVREIDFRPFQDNYVKNAIMVNILQLAVYLGFYDFYTVKQANQDYQLCIETVRVPKGSISISNIASLTVSSLPISGEYKDLQEAITGIDLITQEELSTTDRIITVACVLFPIISGKAVRIERIMRIKAETKALLEKSLKIKNLLKAEDGTEKVFEEVKSVVVNGDKMLVEPISGKTLEFSRAQLKADLTVNGGMSPEKAETILRCFENGCFSSDTLITTRDGLKRIDQIQEGEYVLAKDVNTGTIDYRQVKHVYIKSTYELVHLKLEDEEIKTTASHLFFTDSGWWKAAEHLKPGDRILNSKGELKALIGKSIETLPEPDKIYNLNVEDYHTYFVGTNGLLVHNDCTEAMTAYIKSAVSKADDAARAYGGRNIVGSTFSEIKPTQEIVNWEKVDDYVRKLNAGEQLPAIDVYQVAGKEGWFIEEGHHRYIASQIANKPVPINYKSTSGPAGMSNWQGVTWKQYIDEGQFWDD